MFFWWANCTALSLHIASLLPFFRGSLFAEKVLACGAFSEFPSIRGAVGNGVQEHGLGTYVTALLPEGGTWGPPGLLWHPWLQQAASRGADSPCPKGTSCYHQPAWNFRPTHPEVSSSLRYSTEDKEGNNPTTCYLQSPIEDYFVS